MDQGCGVWEVPERLVRAVGVREGAPGREWLAGLPGLARRYVERWGLTEPRIIRPGGSLGLVVRVTAADGSPAVLKLGLVTAETRDEPAALAHWDGGAAVRLLRADPERGVMLLEGLRDRVSLRSLPEAKAMLEAAEVVRRLWVPPPAGQPFPTVAERTTASAVGLLARRALPWALEARPLIDEALAERDRLTATGTGIPPVLLHGDFRHGNVLAGDRAPWLAIDPEPLVGEPAYDVAWLARDRLETLAAAPSAAALARRRMSALADALGLEKDRLRGWTLFRCVVAGMWHLSVGAREEGELLLEFASWL